MMGVLFDGGGTMSRYASAIAICLAVLPVSAVSAELPLRFVTADGTWDCKDPKGASAGTVVLVEKSYAFIKTDGKLGGYGKLFLIADDLDLPVFAMLSGYMKDELHSSGLAMRGPRDNPHKIISGELYLNVVLSTDGKDDWDCTRRGGRGSTP